MQAQLQASDGLGNIQAHRGKEQDFCKDFFLLWSSDVVQSPATLHPLQNKSWNEERLFVLFSDNDFFFPPVTSLDDIC